MKNRQLYYRILFVTASVGFISMLMIVCAWYGFHISLIPRHDQRFLHKVIVKGTYFLDRYASIQTLPEDFKSRWLPKIEELSRSSKIGVYVGHGMDATPFVPVQLEELGFNVEKINNEHIEKIQACKAIVVPGGYYLPLDWDDKAIKMLSDYVENGGGYVGICLGIFVAQKIGLIKEELEEFPVTGLIPCEIAENNVFRYSPKKKHITLYHMNGKLLNKSYDLNEITPLIFFGKDVVAGTRSYGKGKVVLFSSHPEGGKFEFGNDYVILEGTSLGTMDLLLDAIFYVVNNSDSVPRG